MVGEIRETRSKHGTPKKQNWEILFLEQKDSLKYFPSIHHPWVKYINFSLEYLV